MCRRLEAAWCERGLALGVQVYAAARLRVDPYYLLAILNSKLLSYYFCIMFQGKRMSGGYLAVNKGQLATLPIRAIEPNDPDASQLQRLLIAAARRLSNLRGATSASQSNSRREIARLEWEIDDAVYRLYKVSDESR
jgi:hypothetical protein